MKRLSHFFNRQPLVAVWVGIFIAFVLMELSAALIQH